MVDKKIIFALFGFGIGGITTVIIYASISANVAMTLSFLAFFGGMVLHMSTHIGSDDTDEPEESPLQLL